MCKDKCSADEKRFIKRYKQIGNRIEHYRKLRLYSRDDLSKRTGISIKKIRLMEISKCRYSVSDLLCVAQALAVDVSILMKKE